MVAICKNIIILTLLVIFAQSQLFARNWGATDDYTKEDLAQLHSEFVHPYIQKVEEAYKAYVESNGKVGISREKRDELINDFNNRDRSGEEFHYVVPSDCADYWQSYVDTAINYYDQKLDDAADYCYTKIGQGADSLKDATTSLDEAISADGHLASAASFCIDKAKDGANHVVTLYFTGAKTLVGMENLAVSIPLGTMKIGDKCAGAVAKFDYQTKELFKNSNPKSDGMLDNLWFKAKQNMEVACGIDALETIAAAEGFTGGGISKSVAARLAVMPRFSAFLSKINRFGKTEAGDAKVVEGAVLKKAETADPYSPDEFPQKIGDGRMGPLYRSKDGTTVRKYFNKYGEDRMIDEIRMREEYAQKGARVVRVTKYGEIPGENKFYCEMDYIDGVELGDIIKEGKFTKEVYDQLIASESKVRTFGSLPKSYDDVGWLDYMSGSHTNYMVENGTGLLWIYDPF